MKERCGLHIVNPVGLALLIVGLALFGGAWWAYSKRRAMADTPTSKVRSMAIGPVELKGAAVLPPRASALVAPFTNEACLYWEYAVEEERTRSTTNRDGTTSTETYWETIASDHSRSPIGLEDETGIAVIDPQGAKLPAPLDARYGSGFGRDPPDTVLAFLDKKGLSHETFFGLNKKMRYTERRLGAGTQLYVLGNATRPDTATGEGNAALVVQKKGDGTFMVSTKDEKALVRNWTIGFWAFLLAGIGLAASGAYVLTGA